LNYTPFEGAKNLKKNNVCAFYFPKKKPVLKNRSSDVKRRRRTETANFVTEQDSSRLHGQVSYRQTVAASCTERFSGGIRLLRIAF
jgi:hypothetical protein